MNENENQNNTFNSQPQTFGSVNPPANPPVEAPVNLPVNPPIEPPQNIAQVPAPQPEVVSVEATTNAINPEPPLPVSNTNEATLPPLNTNDDFVFEEKKSKWPLIIILIVLLVVGGALAYYFLVLSPTKMINKIVNNNYIKFSNVMEKASDKEELTAAAKSVAINGSLSLSSTSGSYATLDGTKIGFYFGFDVENEKIYSILKLSQKNVDMLDLTLYLKEKVLYFFSKEIFKETISMDVSGEFPVTTENEDNYNITEVLYLTDKAKNVFLEKMNKNKITKSITNREINGKKVMSAKLAYVVDNEEYKNLVKEILTAYINDDKALEAIYKLDSETYLSKEEVKESLNESLKNIEDIETFTINLYFNLLNNELISVEIINKDMNLSVDVLDDIYYIKYSLKSTNQENGVDTETVTYKADVTYNSTGNKMSGTIMKDKEKYVFNFTVKEDSDVKTTSNFKVEIYDDTESIKPSSTIIIDYTSELNSTIKDMEINKSIKYEDLTEEQMNEIMTNIFTLIGLGSLGTDDLSSM